MADLVAGNTVDKANTRWGRLRPWLRGAPRRWRSCPALGHCAAPAASGPNRSAEGILAQRYADGDITTDEYYERLSLLQAR